MPNEVVNNASGARTEATGRLANVDAMRGIAALAVCWFHFTSGNPQFLADGWLKWSGRYGWAGVEMFFVISGFIVPFSLYRSDYRVAKFPSFLCKRLIRLDPPYLVSIAMIVVLGFLSSRTPGFRGSPFSIDGRQLILHLGYMNAFFDEPWLNPVFWTLAIEFQFYLVIGLCFPLIVAERSSARLASLLALFMLTWVLPHERFVFRYLPLFFLGIAAFYLRVSLISRIKFAMLVICLLGWVWFSFDTVVVLVAGAAVVLLLAHRVTYPRFLLGAGAISYSLYLVHVPIGGRVINLSLRFPADGIVKVAALGGAMAVSLGVAWVLYRSIEAPAQALASRISRRIGFNRE